MLLAVHRLIVLIYLLLPALALVVALWQRYRRRRRAPLRRLYLLVCGGAAISSAVCVASAAVLHGRPMINQVALATYFATALLLLLSGFDRLLWLVLSRLFRLTRLHPAPGHSWWFGLRAATAMLLRATLLLGLGFPYMLAATLTYRPKSQPLADPQSLLHRGFESVSFTSSDGIRLSGWWIPAGTDASPATRTVLLCHGWAGGKASELPLVRRLLDHGYNVLSFDFRARGDSGGQLSSFGDLERRDVLGAVHYLRTARRAQCQRLVGLGVDTGGAALLSAAVDPSPDGQRIDAVAVYGTFDTFSAETAAICRQFIPQPFAWLVRTIGVPAAAVQVGADLAHFSPAAAAAQLWPRPLMVVHGLDDQWVPFERGLSLYTAAEEPKDYDWIEGADAQATLQNADAAAAVQAFFDHARSVL